MKYKTTYKLTRLIIKKEINKTIKKTASLKGREKIFDDGKARVKVK